MRLPLPRAAGALAAAAILASWPLPSLAHEGHRHQQSAPSDVAPELKVEQSGPPAVANVLPKPVAWAGRLHPPLTHFPVALLLAAFVAEGLFALTKRRHFRDAAHFCVWGGALGAVAAAATGWLFAATSPADNDWTLSAHRVVGTTTAAWAVVLLYCSRLPSAVPFRLALLVAAVLVGASGFLGGSLIYGLDHFAW